MLDALTFGLFNKSFRQIKKAQLINATNEKDCVVEVEFSVNSRDYLVRRGIKKYLILKLMVILYIKKQMIVQIKES